MPNARSHAGLAGSLVLAVVLWGASNAGTKFLLGYWPPILTGAMRFLAAGALLHVGLRWAGRMRPQREFEASARRDLWLRSGLVLALYIVLFQWAVRRIPVSHVALYLGAAPVWAALWEQGLRFDRVALGRYFAALVALSGVILLFLPALNVEDASWPGEVAAFCSGWVWTWYGRECGKLGTKLTGAEITAHTMWRAGLWLMVPGLWELRSASLPLSGSLLLVQSYCVVGGGVVAYWLWNHGLRCWPTSRVYLFNNLIPISTMTWAHLTLGEPITPTFGVAMVLIIVGVTIGQGMQRGQPGENSPDEEARARNP
ncbi:MAG: DMT family transporter [Verrucomicrobia bacterium]|nr:DMT family transporter [Verrucomicrobiota bacterium]